MKIAIVETGRPPPAIRSDFPGYPAMFERLLSPALPEARFATLPWIDAPVAPADEFDAFLITGSPAGVYEDHDWLPPLFSLIRSLADAGVPQIGVCFGHQAIAQALGGEVTKSPKGWGLGRHTYDIVESPPFIDPASGTIALAASHQDQVVSPPPGAQLAARSDFANYAALWYPDAPALTFQGHPEFDNAFAAALYSVRRGNPLTDEQVDDAVRSLDRPDQNDTVAQWMARFLRQTLSA